jgi:hypothetical protein
MSRRETPMIHRYWERVGGTLMEEFLAVPASGNCGPRRMDAVILPNGERTRRHWRGSALEGEEVIVIQAKANRLGMYLMGQAVFSAELMRRFKPSKITSVILCRADDSVLRPLLDAYPHVEVVIDTGPLPLPTPRRPL